MKNITFKWKILSIVFISIILSVSIVSIEYIISMKNLSKENIKIYREDSYIKKENELKNYVNIVMEIIEIFHKNSIGKSKEEVEKLKKDALIALGKIKYGKYGFFWVLDKNDMFIMNEKIPKLVGKSLYNLKDPYGNYVFKDVIDGAKANKEGASLKFNWTREDENNPGKMILDERITYANHFKEWGWTTGTVILTDDTEAKIKSMQNIVDKKIDAIIVKILIVTLLFTAIFFVMISMFSTKYIVKPITSFQNSLVHFFKYLNKEEDCIQPLDTNSKDEIGLMSKIVNENILKTQTILEDEERVLENVIQVLEQFQNGDLNQRVNIESSNPSLNNLTILLNKMGDNMQDNIDKILLVLSEYTNYKYINSVDTTNYKEHFLNLANGVNSLGKSITDMLKENKQNGETLFSSSDTLLINVDTLSSSANEAAASLEETSAALEEITANISSNTNNVVEMATYAREVTDSVNTGQNLANQTTGAMNEINQEVNSIYEAITVIDQIAFQTNILSLNAAVEAATAGEAGKGFAVVAQEVRNLASRSAEAAKEIKNLVESATSKANKGKDISDEMIEGYKSLNEKISNTIDLISNVEMASREQQQGIEQINNAIGLLDTQTQNNASIAANTKDIAINTKIIATNVVDDVNKKEF